MIWFGSSAGVALANMYPEAQIGRALAQARLARGHRLRRRLFLHAGRDRLASRRHRIEDDCARARSFLIRSTRGRPKAVSSTAAATTWRSMSEAISSGLKPWSAGISRVCWPGTGATARGVPSANGAMPATLGTGTGSGTSSSCSQLMRSIASACGCAQELAEGVQPLVHDVGFAQAFRPVGRWLLGDGRAQDAPSARLRCATRAVVVGEARVGGQLGRSQHAAEARPIAGCARPGTAASRRPS